MTRDLRNLALSFLILLVLESSFPLLYCLYGFSEMEVYKKSTLIRFTALRLFKLHIFLL